MTTTVDRFWAQVAPAAAWDDCWLWTSTLREGYGRLRVSLAAYYRAKEAKSCQTHG